MFKFDENFKPDSNTHTVKQDTSAFLKLERHATGITKFLEMRAGKSYENGLYRIHYLREMAKWTSIVEGMFSDFQKRIFCFAYDWLGRHFALDFARKSGKQCLILMLEPGTGQVLEIPASFKDFHNKELVEYRNEVLGAHFFELWVSLGGAVPRHSECVGYRQPLFLGGNDDCTNLEISDLEVYWSIVGQLFSELKGVPVGSKISKVKLQA